MKTQEIAIIVLTLLGTNLIGCRDAEPLETKTIEQKAGPIPTLTSTAPSVATTSTEPTGAPVTRVEQVEPDEELEPEPKAAALVPSDESFAPETESFDGLTLVRFVTAPDVEQREPTLVSSRFGTDEERIYAFLEAKNESELDKTLSVHFIGPGQEVSGGIELEIPASAPRWRTWAYTRHARTPGLWHVEIRDEGGTLIGALPFEVEPAL
jgi:hypothetical protein